VTITTCREQLIQTATVEHHLVAAEQVFQLDTGIWRYVTLPDSRSS